MGNLPPSIADPTLVTPSQRSALSLQRRARGGLGRWDRDTLNAGPLAMSRGSSSGHRSHFPLTSDRTGCSRLLSRAPPIPAQSFSPGQGWGEAEPREGGDLSQGAVCLLMGLTLNLKSSWLVEPFMANDWERLRKKGRGSGPREPQFRLSPSPGLALPARGLTCPRRTLRPPRPCWRSHSLRGRAGGRV